MKTSLCLVSFLFSGSPDLQNSSPKLLLGTQDANSTEIRRKTCRLIAFYHRKNGGFTCAILVQNIHFGCTFCNSGPKYIEGWLASPVSVGIICTNFVIVPHSVEGTSRGNDVFFPFLLGFNRTLFLQIGEGVHWHTPSGSLFSNSRVELFCFPKFSISKVRVHFNRKYRLKSSVWGLFSGI